MSVELHHGDCLDVLRAMPDNSVDSIVTDPPYNLSDSGKRDKDCLTRILAEVQLPDTDERDSLLGEGVDLPTPRGKAAPLDGEDRTISVDAQIGMPESAVDLKGSPVSQEEVKHADEAAEGSTDADLPFVADAETVKDLGDFILEPAGLGNPTFCDGTCGCFTEPSAGVIAMTVRAVPAAGLPDSGVVLGRERRRDSDVGLGHDAASQPEGPASVVADAGAVDAFMLRLDLSGRAGELHAAHGTLALHGSPKLRPSEFVGTGAGASGLPSMLEPYRVRVVGDGANRTLTLYLPIGLRHAAKSTRTGGFMGKTWDGWQSPASFQRWCKEWASECLRVLKPGGHLLAFGGTRTWHRLAVGIEDAGFELRDSIAWLSGSGFPKSLDVSKAIDKARGDLTPTLAVTCWLRDEVKRAGMTRAQLKALGPFTEGQVVHWLAGTASVRPGVPTWDQWLRLQEVIGFGSDMDADVWRLNGRKGTPGEAWDQREIVGTIRNNQPGGTSAFAQGGIGAYQPGDTRERQVRGGPATDAARTWQGWGTALKPAHEPIVVARKPLAGTVAANVLQHGTGALNIDATRVAGEVPSVPQPDFTKVHGERTRLDAYARNGEMSSAPGGRWPANVVLDESQAEVLGEPSRFFYVAKAPKSERPVVNGVSHPTVKPVTLLRWLVRLVTPPGGTILEPFAGSGTTVEAALLEGFRVVAIEREADYLPLIEARIARVAARAAQVEPDLFAEDTKPPGRWPPNVVMDRSQAEVLDEQSGISPARATRTGRKGGSNPNPMDWDTKHTDQIGTWPGDNGGGASRFFPIFDDNTDDEGDAA